MNEFLPGVTRRVFLAEVTAAGAVLVLAPHLKAAGATMTSPFRSGWQRMPDRAWAGPDFWTNPMQDWRIANGRLECIKAALARNVHVLTRDLLAGAGTLLMSVRLGRVGGGPMAEGKGSAGFSIGVKTELEDYRHSLIYGSGLELGIRTKGELFIGVGKQASIAPLALGECNEVELRMELEAKESNRPSRLRLAAYHGSGGQLLGECVHALPSGVALAGNLALCANFGAMSRTSAGRDPAAGEVDRWWFQTWTIAGTKISDRPERAFGPLFFNHYTVHEGTMKMAVQLAPIGPRDETRVRFQVKREGTWTTMAEATVDPVARNATFRVDGWDARADVPYRVAYALKDMGGPAQDCFLEGVVRRDPVAQPTITVADISCNAHFAFPNTACVAGIAKLDPDLIAFTGDQYYEASAGFGVDRSGGDASILDVLRKWTLHGWTWRDLLRDRPAVSIPDDHDVYHGNLWGEGGAKAPGNEPPAEAKGGYKMEAAFVNAVHRMQTSHHPDSPGRPGLQGITAYYGPLTYGGIGFAILADRQFKSAPDGTVPPTGSGRADHVVDPAFDPKTADLPGLTLLGDAQMSFLRAWTDEWRGAEMKAVISQTLFTAMATHHGPRYERLIADYDTNAWPQSARNAVLREMRRVFAFHIAGDQHLPAVVHYGIDGPRDGVVAFASPAVNNVYPRKFEPEGATAYTGDFRDSFGHPMAVLASANAKPTFRSGVLDMEVDKACGFGVVRFNKPGRTITIECWPLLADPGQAGTQFPGWPVTVSPLSNYGKAAPAQLPELRVAGATRPVISVIDEKTGETVYSARMPSTGWRPSVFSAGSYTLLVTVPETGAQQRVTGVSASSNNTAVLALTVRSP